MFETLNRLCLLSFLLMCCLFVFQIFASLEYSDYENRYKFLHFSIWYYIHAFCIKLYNYKNIKLKTKTNESMFNVEDFWSSLSYDMNMSVSIRMISIVMRLGCIIIECLRNSIWLHWIKETKITLNTDKLELLSSGR